MPAHPSPPLPLTLTSRPVAPRRAQEAKKKNEKNKEKVKKEEKKKEEDKAPPERLSHAAETRAQDSGEVRGHVWVGADGDACADRVAQEANDDPHARHARPAKGADACIDA